ncbi:GH92 family glycosyl hydrolase [Polaribacter ponticola]|uniref:GH92 family glycosyl hydrolase n=1 Tax=Polaribacter ponticola TaxID=2978475 RepID=A0ABT5S5Z6_9FLAO|nr:GH92 family glycosyl hydrolase [Polaribacter sp. MSW5]MDD7913529.1 GH92 family glycosyl hydrolase [Polaribacter sp. MSW5]
MKRIFIFLSAILIIACSENTVKTPVDYVNVFIGTKAPGHTYPGPTLPFGMVQLGPDTRNDHTSWPACAGYDYTDTSIFGFTHTHLSGTGVPDLGDILLMPTTGKIQTETGTIENTESGYRSKFSHKNETASPGYYSVLLDDYNVKAELTTTLRTGMHRYTFPKTDAAHIIIDLEHRDPVIEAEFNIISKTEISGYRRSKAWAGNQRQYFVAKFSKPFISYEILNGESVDSVGVKFNNKKIIAALNFNASNSEVLVQVALSAVSIEGAKKNLEAEFANWDFDKTKEQARETWQKSLSKIQVTDNNEDKKEIFYTSLYHSLLTPNLYSDVDGKYRGMDDAVHTANGFNNYTVFSLWDTFRGLHPLLTIVEPKVTRDIVVTLQKKYEQFGELPMWELAANDTRCMIGYHAVSVMADAYVKGITDVDANKVLEAMVASANVNKRGINYYTELGFVPTNKSSQSVSKTLEYAYDDWCIAQMAKAIGNTEMYDEFSKRARFFENLFDKETNFMRPRYSDRKWYENFDPTSVGQTYNFNFTEGNSYQYSLFVPHDIATMVELVGGEKHFDEWLDNLFNAHADEEEEDSDVSGLIGQYAHGNEPSHHIAYLYNYVGKPWKTQEKVHEILNKLYSSEADGLCGNDDAGQMSAWYVLSSLGFYSVTPGSPNYVIASPSFKEAVLDLDNGKKFTIKANNASKENIYFSSLTLNGKAYPYSYLKHEDILKGGELVFEMTNVPNKEWATNKEFWPLSDTQKTVKIPFLKSDDKVFLNSMTVDLDCETTNTEIFYTTDGSEPNQTSKKFTKPFNINKTTILKVKAYHNKIAPSYTAVYNLEKQKPVKNINRNQLVNGLNYGYYEGIFRSVYDFSREQPIETGVVNTVEISKKIRDEWIGFDFTGYIDIPESGTYNFEISANDGAQLLIDSNELFESDGRKSFSFTQKNDIILSKGLHKFEVKYFQCSDNIGLNVFWKGSNFKRQEIPAISFYRKK